MTATTVPTRLNLGGQKGDHPRLPGWHVVDLRDGADTQADIATDTLPYADGSIDVVFTSHTLEHVPIDRLEFVLSEIRRVLKPDGLLRVLVPDMALALDAYLNSDIGYFRSVDLTYHDPSIPIGGLIRSFAHSVSSVGNGHVNSFTEQSLTWWLDRAGFEQIERSKFNKSTDEELRTPGFDRSPELSLIIEARAPSVDGAAP